MKRVCCICFIALMYAVPLFARPYDRPPRNGPPHHHHHHHHYHHYPNSGLYTAAGIVSLVGASLGTFRALTEPRVIVTAPVQPVVVAPPVQPVVYSQPVVNYVQEQQPATPQPRRITINPDGSKVIEY